MARQAGTGEQQSKFQFGKQQPKIPMKLDLDRDFFPKTHHRRTSSSSVQSDQLEVFDLASKGSSVLNIDIPRIITSSSYDGNNSSHIDSDNEVPIIMHLRDGSSPLHSDIEDHLEDTERANFDLIQMPESVRKSIFENGDNPIKFQTPIKDEQDQDLASPLSTIRSEKHDIPVETMNLSTEGFKAADFVEIEESTFDTPQISDRNRTFSRLASTTVGASTASFSPQSAFQQTTEFKKLDRSNIVSLTQVPLDADKLHLPRTPRNESNATIILEQNSQIMQDQTHTQEFASQVRGELEKQKQKSKKSENIFEKCFRWINSK